MAIEESWQKLAHAIKEIQKHNASKLSFEESYRYSYNMVLYKRELSLAVPTLCS
jgi:cullin 3